MNGKCGGVTWSKCRTVVIWLVVLFLTTLFTLLFIMCFIHFLKNNHSPPIVPNDLQDYSTTKSIYFLLSFYFLLWTVVYLGCTIFTVIPRRSDHSHPNHNPNHSSENPGKALLIVLLILLSIITLLLCTIDRIYSPWIMNFVRGTIFNYCVQVSALITTTVGICYIFVLLTLGFCSNQKALSSGSGNSSTSSHPTLTILRAVNSDHNGTPLKHKSSFANPCYNIEFSLADSVRLENGVGQGVTQV